MASIIIANCGTNANGFEHWSARYNSDDSPDYNRGHVIVRKVTCVVYMPRCQFWKWHDEYSTRVIHFFFRLCS